MKSTFIAFHDNETHIGELLAEELTDEYLLQKLLVPKKMMLLQTT